MRSNPDLGIASLGFLGRRRRRISWPNRRHLPERGDPIQRGTKALDQIGRCRVTWAASLGMEFRASSPATARGRTSMLS